MSKFSERLRTLRKERGLSQQQLADYVDMSKSSINMYERGEREPGLELLESFADYFNVDMDYLVGKSEIRSRYAVQSDAPPIQPADDAAIKFALFGDVDVDDAVYDEVKRFAAFARTQAEKKQNR